VVRWWRGAAVAGFVRRPCGVVDLPEPRAVENALKMANGLIPVVTWALAGTFSGALCNRCEGRDISSRRSGVAGTKSLKRHRVDTRQYGDSAQRG
jgi:hypothetical protein